MELAPKPAPDWRGAGGRRRTKDSQANDLRSSVLFVVGASAASFVARVEEVCWAL